MADYKAGNLDAAIELDPAFSRTLQNVPGSKSVASPAIGFHELGFNCYDSPKSKGNPLLKDVHIRQAINWAIDKPAIASVAMDNLAEPGTSLLSPVDTVFHWNVPENEQYSYDPAKAKQILDDAGYKVGADGVRVAPSGKPLKFRLAAFTEYPMDITAAKKITSYLKDVGIATTLQVMDENAFTDANYDNADDDLYIWNWNADIDPGYILSVFTTGQILNGSDSEYSNPEYDKLYVDQAHAVDTGQRQQLITQMQQILYRDSPYSILWYNVNVQAFRTDRWTGYSSVPTGGDGAAFRNMLRTTYVDLKPETAAARGDEQRQQHGPDRRHRRRRGRRRDRRRGAAAPAAAARDGVSSPSVPCAHNEGGAAIRQPALVVLCRLVSTPQAPAHLRRPAPALLQNR